MMAFEEAFDKFIKDQPITCCGFQLLKRVQQPDGYFRELGGYYTTFANGYRLMFYGENLEQTPVQEALILDPHDVVIARDTEDLRWANTNGNE
jgi:hypothetical protein